MNIKSITYDVIAAVSLLRIFITQNSVSFFDDITGE